MDGIVVDLNKRRSPIPSGGTEIKLKPFFRHTSINLKLEDLVGRYKYDAEDADCIDEVPSVAQATLEMTPRIDVFNFSSK